MFNLTFYEAIEKVMTGNFIAIGELFSGYYEGYQIEKRGTLKLVNKTGFVTNLDIGDWMVNQKYKIETI